MNRRRRLLDLCCGVGGASKGYADAGFEVVGVDLVRQPDYPFEFHLGNALSYPLGGFDVVHASPPCKAHTGMSTIPQQGDAQASLFDAHAAGDVLGPVLDRLRAWGGVWVVENVPGARAAMPAGAVTYCGSSFGLPVRRHRLFASSVQLVAPPCAHPPGVRAVGVYGHGGGHVKGQRMARGAEAAAALGIGWTSWQPSLSQAIPPAYTEHIGRQLTAYPAPATPWASS